MFLRIVVAIDQYQSNLEISIKRLKEGFMYYHLWERRLREKSQTGLGIMIINQRLLSFVLRDTGQRRRAVSIVEDVRAYTRPAIHGRLLLSRRLRSIVGICVCRLTPLYWGGWRVPIVSDGDEEESKESNGHFLYIHACSGQRRAIPNEEQIRSWNDMIQSQ